MITIKVNDVTMEVENKSNVNNLLQDLKTNTDGIAVAINNEIVPKANWNAQQLLQDDAILIIQATQGG